MAKLLLVEDDTSLGETLQERLQKEGYDVQWVTTQAEALGAVKASSFDLLILDVSLPDGTGFELAEKVRAHWPTPFLFMTALSTAENRLQGFELGAEEFLPKPFHLKELILRLRHVLSQHRSLRRVKCGEWWIDLDSSSLVNDQGERKTLAHRDFQLLKMLIEAAPQVVSRDQILDKIWGEDQFPTPRTVDNAIVRLRSELGDVNGHVIRTVRGVGYQWGLSNE
jgi:two-component system phosphate regulon response regulator PhoB